MKKYITVDPNRAPMVVVLSGAGLSADSGIATFRGTTGLWEGYDVNQVANGMTWKQNWDLVRRFYNDRRTTLATATPNAMHVAIAKWQKQYTTVNLTQNIDDLLERAGCDNVIHLHGELTQMKCVACGHKWNIGYNTVNDTDRCASEKCNSIKGTRPNVVFFNEPAPNYRKLYNTFRQLQSKDCVVVVGTSGVVIDVNSLLFDCSALKILNNLETSSSINEDYFDHVVVGNASVNADLVDKLVSSHLKG